MIEISAKLESDLLGAARGQLSLPFELRQKRWLFTALVTGEEVALRLPRGATLRDGDLLLASDGRVIEVIAAPERVVHVECATPSELARVAYHLGNRHAPVQVGDGCLRILADAVLEEMLSGLGAKLTNIEAPFQPEAGAYRGAHFHRENSDDRAPRMHEFGGPEHSRE